MHDDVYQLYLDEIAAIRPMDTEEESLLLEKLKSGDTTVRTRLMEGYLPFIGRLQRLTRIRAFRWEIWCRRRIWR